MASYQSYLDTIEKLDEEQLDAHLRESYREESQLLPDYLDYVDRWKFDFDRCFRNIRRDFIYHVLASRRQTIVCGDHQHRFVPSPTEKGVCVERPDTYIPTDCCWYQEICKTVQHIERKSGYLSARLSHPEFELLKRTTGLSMTSSARLHESSTFSNFREFWWNSESRSRALNMVQHVHLPNIIDELAHVALDCNEPEGSWFMQSTEGPARIYTALTVASDHGFHALLMARSDWKYIFKVVNKIRSLSSINEDWTDLFILPSDVADAIKHCRYCKQYSPGRCTTYPGIYYAPPGNGKTTCMDKELFIGVDTDWLVHGTTFRSLAAPFINADIPIITNQKHLAIDGGQRVFGIYNPKKIRTIRDEWYGRQPIESVPNILRYVGLSSGDLQVYRAEKYLSDEMLSLMMCQYIYNTTRSIHLAKPFDKGFPSRSSTTTPEELISQLEGMKPLTTSAALVSHWIQRFTKNPI